jgi:YegS/Rv2252/BmrU family lipid kinase
LDRTETILIHQAKSRIKAFVVLNPVAGESDPEMIKRIFDRHLDRGDWHYELYETTGTESLPEVIKLALNHDFDLFVVAGGDGTVAGVAGGLVHTGLPLGIIPVGTGNALARELNIPLDIEEAVSLLTGDHATVQIDTMQINEQYFTLNVTVGVSSSIIRSTGRASKRRFGRLAYIWSGIKGLFGFQPRNFKLQVDGQHYRFRASELAVLNAGILGGSPFRWGPNIHLNDGDLNVAIVRIRTFFDFFRLGWDVLRDRQKQDPNVRYLKVKHQVGVDSDRPLLVQADGEVIGQTPVRVKLVASALAVIVPKTTEL